MGIPTGLSIVFSQIPIDDYIIKHSVHYGCRQVYKYLFVG